MANPFRHSRNNDPKLVLIRRADTGRDATHTIGGRKKLPKRPITLAPVPTLDKPENDQPVMPSQVRER